MIEVKLKNGQVISFTDVRELVEFEKQFKENGNGQSNGQTDNSNSEKKKEKKPRQARQSTKEVDIPVKFYRRKIRIDKQKVLNDAVDIVNKSKSISVSKLCIAVLGSTGGTQLNKFRRLIHPAIKSGQIIYMKGKRKHMCFAADQKVSTQMHATGKGYAKKIVLDNLDYIKANYRTKLAVDLAKTLKINPRTFTSVIWQLQKAGKLPQKRYQGRQAENEKFVLDNIDKMSVSDMAKAVGIKTNTMHTYIWRLRNKGKIGKVEAKATIETDKKIEEPHYMIRDHPQMHPKCVDCNKPIPIGFKRCKECNELKNKLDSERPFDWDVLATDNLDSIELRPIVERLVSHKEIFDFTNLKIGVQPKEARWRTFEKLINKLFLYQKEILKACNAVGKFVYDSHLKQVEFRGDLA